MIESRNLLNLLDFYGILQKMNHARVNSIGHQLISHGIGVVSESAARKIAERVHGPVRNIDGRTLVDIIRELARDGEIEVLEVGGSLAIE